VFAGFTNSASMNGDQLSTAALPVHPMQHGGVWIGNDVMPSNTKAAQRTTPTTCSFSGAMAQFRRGCYLKCPRAT
jgi:hypothetical protein